jgi:hypothetical protein
MSTTHARLRRSGRDGRSCLHYREEHATINMESPPQSDPKAFPQSKVIPSCQQRVPDSEGLRAIGGHAIIIWIEHAPIRPEGFRAMGGHATTDMESMPQSGPPVFSQSKSGPPCQRRSPDIGGHTIIIWMEHAPLRPQGPSAIKGYRSMLTKGLGAIGGHAIINAENAPQSDPGGLSAFKAHRAMLVKGARIRRSPFPLGPPSGQKVRLTGDFSRAG